MSNIPLLAVDIVILILQTTTIISNGFILYIFFRAKKLRLRFNLRLLIFLSAADFLHAMTTLPYTIYLIASWKSATINLNPYYVLISSAPLIVQLKINLTLTICIAFERIMALFFPATYRELSYPLYTTICLLIGCTLAVFDLILEFLLSPFRETPNCAAMGCFLSDAFAHYWGFSNMIMGVTVIILTVLLIVKLKLIQFNSQSVKSDFEKHRVRRINQANRISAGVILISLTFVTLPSVCVSLVKILGSSTFETVGPFYIVGLLCSGTCQSMVYVVLNRDVRKMAKACLLGNDCETITLKEQALGRREIDKRIVELRVRDDFFRTRTPSPLKHLQ